MECKKLKLVEGEEYVINVVFEGADDTLFFTRLRFALLASSWLPRPQGIFFWRVLHMFLVAFLVLYIPVRVLLKLIFAVFFDVAIRLILISFLATVTLIYTLMVSVTMIILLVVLCQGPRKAFEDAFIVVKVFCIVIVCCGWGLPPPGEDPAQAEGGSQGESQNTTTLKEQFLSRKSAFLQFVTEYVRRSEGDLLSRLHDFEEVVSPSDAIRI